MTRLDGNLPMAEPIIPVGAISKLFDYFNPSRSPYYSIAVASCLAISYVCDVATRGMWLTLAIPAFIVAALTFALSLDGINVLDPLDHAEQLRFARSTCISVAILALAYFGKDITDNSVHIMPLFSLTAILCCSQIAIFLLYQWALNRTIGNLPNSTTNYVQITLLTSAFLVDTVYNLSQASHDKDIASLHHLVTAAGLGALWIFCIAFWIAKLKTIIVVERVEQQPTPAMRAAAAGTGSNSPKPDR